MRRTITALRAEGADERERRTVGAFDVGAEAEDALLPREPPQLGDEPLPDATPLAVVNDLEGDLRLRRGHVADEAGDPHRAAGLGLDGRDRLAPAATDVDEEVEVGLEEPRLRPEKAQPPAALGEAGEDVEDWVTLAVAEATEDDRVHTSSVARADGAVGTAGHTLGLA